MLKSKGKQRRARGKKRNAENTGESWRRERRVF
jgi:hypothetical protein